MRRFEQLAPTFRSAYESFPFSWVYLTAADEATDPALAAEIDQVNAEAGAAVLYFRTPDGIKHLGAKDAVASQSAEVGSAVERLLSRCHGPSARAMPAFVSMWTGAACSRHASSAPAGSWY